MNKEICRYIDEHKADFVELESLLSSIPVPDPRLAREKDSSGLEGDLGR